jgi:hypothetical protein
MHRSISLAPRSAFAGMLTDGTLAGVLSAIALVWRGRRETASGAAPINSVSHWLWPGEAFRRQDVTLKHTAVGAAVHYASSLFWAALYAWMRERRLKPTPLNAVTDATAVTALAATVDLRLVPERLTPGFEKRLSKPSLGLVYLCFGAGLALGGLLALRER